MDNRLAFIYGSKQPDSGLYIKASYRLVDRVSLLTYPCLQYVLPHIEYYESSILFLLSRKLVYSYTESK